MQLDKKIRYRLTDSNLMGRPPDSARVSSFVHHKGKYYYYLGRGSEDKSVVILKGDAGGSFLASAWEVFYVMEEDMETKISYATDDIIDYSNLPMRDKARLAASLRGEFKGKSYDDLLLIINKAIPHDRLTRLVSFRDLTGFTTKKAKFIQDKWDNGLSITQELLNEADADVD